MSYIAQRRRWWLRHGLNETQSKPFLTFPISRPYIKSFLQKINEHNREMLSEHELWQLFRQAYDTSVVLGNYPQPKGKQHHKIADLDNPNKRAKNLSKYEIGRYRY